MRLFTIWPTSQPMAAAASAAVLVPSGKRTGATSTPASRPASITRRTFLCTPSIELGSLMFGDGSGTGRGQDDHPDQRARRGGGVGDPVGARLVVEPSDEQRPTGGTDDRHELRAAEDARVVTHPEALRHQQ